MATLAEIRELFNNDDFRNKVTSATVIAANNLLSGTPSVDEKVFAKNVFETPDAMGKIVTMSVLAANSGLTKTQIENANDAAIQTNVDSVIPNLVGV